MKYDILTCGVSHIHSHCNEKRITCVDILTSQFSLSSCTEYTMKMPESSDPGYLNYFEDFVLSANTKHYFPLVNLNLPQEFL
jgi:hypothetical protein